MGSTLDALSRPAVITDWTLRHLPANVRPGPSGRMPDFLYDPLLLPELPPTRLRPEGGTREDAPLLGVVAHLHGAGLAGKPGTLSELEAWRRTHENHTAPRSEGGMGFKDHGYPVVVGRGGLVMATRRAVHDVEPSDHPSSAATLGDGLASVVKGAHTSPSVDPDGNRYLGIGLIGADVELDPDEPSSWLQLHGYSLLLARLSFAYPTVRESVEAGNPKTANHKHGRVSPCPDESPNLKRFDAAACSRALELIARAEREAESEGKRIDPRDRLYTVTWTPDDSVISPIDRFFVPHSSPPYELTNANDHRTASRLTAQTHCSSNFAEMSDALIASGQRGVEPAER